MPTEELERELRRSFSKAAAGYQHPELARERLLRRNYRPGRSFRRHAASITAAAAAGAVALGLGLSGAVGSAHSGGGVSAAHSVRARLMAAIEAARGDIIMTGGRPSGPHTGSGYSLVYPWYPRPGQQVRVRNIWWDARGKLWGESWNIFRMPPGHSIPVMNPIDGSYDLSVTHTFIVVYPARHAWAEWHHNTQLVGMPVDAAGLRRQLANGRFKIIRRTVLDGHKAIELSMTGLNPRMTGLHATEALMWVDAASYLPLRQVLRFSTGRVDIGYFRFLPPTPANLAKLHVVIPAGYHRTWLRPGQAHHR
jgi:hypothetical protein